MQRSLTMLFAFVAYAIFFATFLYLIAFVGNLPMAPVTVDRGAEAPMALALAVNIGLIALFGVQHSVMARQGFKRFWTRVVPWPAERSVYVLMASAMLIILMALWQPIDGMVWSVAGESARMILWSLFGLGWLTVLLSTFLINHSNCSACTRRGCTFADAKGPPRNSASRCSTNGCGTRSISASSSPSGRRPT